MQATIWDNLHLIIGLDHLSKLEMDAAVEQLNMALNKGTIQKEDAQLALEVAKYWQPRIQSDTAPSKTLLSDYLAFTFTPRIHGFQKKLLCFIAEKISNEHTSDLRTVETVFDALLTLKDFTAAEKFAASLHFPEKQKQLYLLAQAQWHNKGKGKANKTYVQALLLAPDDLAMNRIENTDLKTVITQFGAEMAPAYGWIKGIVPFVACKAEIQAHNESHQTALDSYHYLQQAHSCLKNNDTKAATIYRKKLLETAPQLFEAYFEMLKSRK